MSYALSRPSNVRRSGLLGIVIGLHVGVLLFALAAKVIAPQIAELPIIVDMITPPTIQPVALPKPLPAAKPTPRPQPKPQAQPKLAPSPIETTTSNIPSAAAPIAAPPETKPAPFAPPTQNPEPLSQARFDADYLRNPAPAYPPLAKRMGEEGKVVLRVQVTPQGNAESIEIKTSSGSQRLDDSALKTVRSWKFIPAKRGDTPVASSVLVPIIFKLEQ